jgi:hypothetical protein
MAHFDWAAFLIRWQQDRSDEGYLGLADKKEVDDPARANTPLQKGEHAGSPLHVAHRFFAPTIY